jgi:hypothetical protein
MPSGLAALGNLAASRLAANFQVCCPGRAPRLINAGHGKPVVGGPLKVWWESRRAAQAMLHWKQGDHCRESIVPVSGAVQIPVLSASAIAISLSLLPRRVTADTVPTVYRFPLILPHVQSPRFARLDVPPWVTLGDKLEILWDAPGASGVEIFVDDGRRVQHQTCHSAGVRHIATTHPGRWLVRLVAQGLHGTTPATRFVAVTAAPPRIQLNQRTVFGKPGTRAEFRWTITHARAAFLECPARHERHEIGLSGALKTEIGHVHEEFWLTTIGLDGRYQTTVLATTPYAYPDFLSPE